MRTAARAAVGTGQACAAAAQKLGAMGTVRSWHSPNFLVAAHGPDGFVSRVV